MADAVSVAKNQQRDGGAAERARRRAMNPREARPSPADVSLVIRRVRATVVVTVGGTLDSHFALLLDGLLRDLVDNQGNRAVAVELGGASCADPAVLGVLEAVATSAKRRGSAFWVEDPSEQLCASVDASNRATSIDIRWPEIRDGAGSSALRPLERRILRLVDAGLGDAEIARRFRRSPNWVRRIRYLAALPRQSGAESQGATLRPLERRVLRWRARGVSHDSLADKFRCSAEFVARVEQLANYKLRDRRGGSHPGKGDSPSWVGA